MGCSAVAAGVATSGKLRAGLAFSPGETGNPKMSSVVTSPANATIATTIAANTVRASREEVCATL